IKLLFTNRTSLNTRLALAFLASLTLFFLDARLNYFSGLRSHLATALYPVQIIASFPNDIGHWASDYFQTRTKLSEQNASLKAINLLNSVRLQKLQALERENLRLHELLGSSFRLPERVIVAELLTIDSDPYSQQVVINRGALYDVFEGQPVLDARGVMGQVASVSRFSSRVILLTDPSHAIPVQVNRNGLRSVATGRGLSNPLQLAFLPHNADIRIGDLLVTSGLGGRFPVGYPVGTVSDIAHIAGKPFVNVKVKPAADLETSREVLLVLPNVDEIGIEVNETQVTETEVTETEVTQAVEKETPE
ncbi:UNVERIFIED_CONTAM: hypothetical protein GTU68_016397, partial [Idotea baltica]|nr:hypothetical protein [Idotea baltica]